ncbi:MAG: murein biosynthesis integral membrane protein MurJ [Alphaproteobacteria bacterium]
MKIIRSVLSVGGFTVLSRITGFVRETLQAHYIGVNVVSDAIGIAIKVPSLFRRIFAEGAFNASFVPMFSGVLATEGRKEALNFAQNIFSLLCFVLLGLTIVVELLLPNLIPMLFRGLGQTPERLLLTIEFSKITFPFLFFISLTAFFSGILNSFERFVAAAASPAAGNLFIIACMLYLSPTVKSAGYALAWGVLGCGVVQFLWVFVPCKMSDISVKITWPKITPSLRKFFKIMLPAALGSGVVQINLFLDIMIASYLKVGGISYMNYADRLAQLPLSVIGVAMSTVLLPTLSKHWRKKESQKALETQTIAIESSLALAVPAMVGLIMLAPFLIEHLYQHGEFKASDIAPTSHTLMALASGLPAYILVKLFSTVFFSNGDTKTPMWIGLGCMALNVALNLILIGSMEYVGLALSTSVASWTQTLLMGTILRKRKMLDLKHIIQSFCPRLFVSIGLLILYIKFINPWVELALTRITVSSWILLPGVLGLAFGVYMLIAYATGTFHFGKIQSKLNSIN